MADRPDYSKMKEEVQGEMARLAQERERMDDEITRLKKLLADLDACTRLERIDGVSASQRQEPDMQIIEAVRTVVRRNSPRSVSPTEIRDRLLRKGYKRAHLLTDIHGALRRLRERGEVKNHRILGRKVYVWK